MSDRHKAAIKRWQDKNPERRREIARNSYHRKKLEDPKFFYSKKIWKERKRAAAKRGIPFTITHEYLLSLPCEVCPVFGWPLEWGTGSLTTASLDRVIPELGYVEGNVVWMSRRANTLKLDSTVEELEKILDWYKNVNV